MDEPLNKDRLLETILAEIRAALSEVKKEALHAFVERITKARQIFVAGTGRSGLMARAFAMRLMHLGLKACVVGETVTPGIAAGDLLLIASGSGETGSMRVMAEKARKLGAVIALITAFPGSSIGRLADEVIALKAPTPKGGGEQAFSSIQPMGSLFEQSLLLLLDLIVLYLMEALQTGPEEMFARHANLE